MKLAASVVNLVLWVWFFGCIVTYKTKKFVLVEGMGVKSVEFGALCLFSLALALFFAMHAVGKWVLLAVLALWFTVQFFCHWRYTIFGVSQEKLCGYNACFQNTLHLIPASTKRLVPDFYHMVLHLLIAVSAVLTALS